MYLPNSDFHDAFKDPTTYPQDIIIENPNGFFSAFDGDIESSGVQIEEYFCTSEDLSYGECPSSTLKASLINKGNLRSVTWDDLWSVYIGYRSKRINAASSVNASIHWVDGNTYTARTTGLYRGNVAIDTSGECYSLFASDGAETLYAFGDGYTYAIDQTGYAQKITPPKYMIDKFRKPMSMYWDSDYEGEGWAYCERTFKEGGDLYKEEWKYIRMGTFFVTKPKNLSDAVVEIEGAYDQMHNFDKESTSLIEYMNRVNPDGATIRSWVTATCIYANAPSPILPDLSQDLYKLDSTTAGTLREILANLAECYSGVFRYNRQGQMVLSKVGTEMVEEIEPRRIEESSLSVAEYNTTPPDALINKTISGLTYTQGLPPEECKNPYYILGNPFIQNNGYISLRDYEFYAYRPMSFVVLEADPMVDVGDMIGVYTSDERNLVFTDLYDNPFEDGDGNLFVQSNTPLYIPLMHRVLQWNGVCTATYECTGNEYRLAPYGAELTNYNSNVANNASNIINKIEANTVVMRNAEILGGKIHIDTDLQTDDIIKLNYVDPVNPGYVESSTEMTPSGISVSDEPLDDSLRQAIVDKYGVKTGYDGDVAYMQPNAVFLWDGEVGGSLTRRAILNKSGVFFYDTNGDLTTSYPSTGMHTLLFSGLQGGGGSTLTLSEPKSNFAFILYVLRTNVEYTSVLLPSSMPKMACVFGAGSWTSNNCWQYNAYYEATFSSQTQATCNDSYNNGNFRLKIVAVYGINRVAN